MLTNKNTRAYLVLSALVICGLVSSVVTADKVAHLGVDFPFCNLVFSIFTYPIVDCICEIWGKKTARQTIFLALACQLLVVILLQISIAFPHASFWQQQSAYQLVLSASGRVIIASLLAFVLSQLIDIMIYQRIRIASKGKWLWLRSNTSTIIGQCIDSSLFIFIVFYASSNKLNILFGSILIKAIISLLMTPIVYAIVIVVNRYLDSNTLVFKAAEH